MSHNKNCIGAFLPRFIVALRHASKVFSKDGLSYLHRGGVIHQFLYHDIVSPVVGCIMGIAKCSKLVAVASSFGHRFSEVNSWGELFQTLLVRKLMAC